MMCLVKTQEDKSRVTREVTRNPGEGGMSCCGGAPSLEEMDEVSRLVSTKLAAFVRTLRDNGFAVGLSEGRDAAALMASGYAAKPGLLRSALKHLFSARKSDWDKFDGIFEAFWLGKRVRSRSMAMGSSKAANNPSLKSLQDNQSQAAGSDAATDNSVRRRRAAGARRRRPHGRRLRADNIAEIDFRKLADPDQMPKPMPPRPNLQKRCARG